MKSGLVFLLLALAPAVRAQPAPSPAGPPAAETTPPDQAGNVPPADQLEPTVYPPPSAPPPAYPGPGYSPPPSAAPPAAYAQARVPGAQNHDGFYLRLQVGVGYTSMSSSLNGTGRSLAGGGTGFDLALGAALNPHLIIYGTLISAMARHPETTFSGQPPNSGISKGMIAGTVDVGGFGAAGVVGVGGGMAYYLDSNLFFAGSLLGSRLFREGINGEVVARSDLGFTFEGLVGKEWWVSANWGLGVCGQVLLGAMKDRPNVSETVPTWKLAVFSALFTASYN